jgi:hypothetical protein
MGLVSDLTTRLTAIVHHEDELAIPPNFTGSSLIPSPRPNQTAILVRPPTGVIIYHPAPAISPNSPKFAIICTSCLSRLRSSVDQADSAKQISSIETTLLTHLRPQSGAELAALPPESLSLMKNLWRHSPKCVGFHNHDSLACLLHSMINT